MAGTFINNGDGTTTIRFSYSGETDKIQASALKIAESLWFRGLGDHGTEALIYWEDLTNQEKLNLIDDHLFSILKNIRDSYIHYEYDEAVNVDADTDIETNYELGES